MEEIDDNQHDRWPMWSRVFFCARARARGFLFLLYDRVIDIFFIRSFEFIVMDAHHHSEIVR